MDLNNVRQEIRLFIGIDEKKFKYHKIGGIEAYTFSNPSITILFKQNSCFVLYDNKRYSDVEFVRLLELKTYW